MTFHFKLDNTACYTELVSYVFHVRFHYSTSWYAQCEVKLQSSLSQELSSICVGQYRPVLLHLYLIHTCIINKWKQRSVDDSVASADRAFWLAIFRSSVLSYDCDLESKKAFTFWHFWTTWATKEPIACHAAIFR